MKRAPRLTWVKVPLAASCVVIAGALVVHAVAPQLVTTAIVALSLFVGLVQARRLVAPLDERFEALEAAVAQTEPLLELGARLRPRLPLPPMQGYAIAPDFALLLTTLISEEEPEIVVETGSGVSTLVIAYGLERLGRGRVIALELDAAHAAKTRAEIARHGLGAYATVVHAPLEPLEIDGEPHVWHALAALDGLTRVDLVVDDGPPRYLGEMLRYASLPTFAKLLGPRGVFALDYIDEEERRILALWQRRHPEFVQEHLRTKKGNAILRRAIPADRRALTPPEPSPAGGAPPR